MTGVLQVDRVREAGRRMIKIQTEELRKRQYESMGKDCPLRCGCGSSLIFASFVEAEDTALVQVTWNKAGPGSYTQESLEEILGKVNW